jgi:Lrp/AsnC family transcriptional regulator, leucine-responsive regulatory protein
MRHTLRRFKQHVLPTFACMAALIIHKFCLNSNKQRFMLTMTIDPVDLRILKALQQDAKLTNLELAARVHLSPSPCLARVRQLERHGLISRYVTLLDAAKLGLGVSVFIQIRLEKQIERALEDFEAAMQRYPEVMECYLMSGDSDYMIRVVVGDVPTLERFIVDQLSKIPGVANIRSSFALKQVKYNTELPLQEAPAAARKAPRAGGRRR